jgi:hypothetical protein
MNRAEVRFAVGTVVAYLLGAALAVAGRPHEEEKTPRTVAKKADGVGRPTPRFTSASLTESRESSPSLPLQHPAQPRSPPPRAF